VNGLARTLGDVANAAAQTAHVVPQLAQAFGAGGHGTGAEVAVNPVWATLAQVLNEVSAGFRVTGLPLRPDQETFLRVVEHLAQVANGLALHPADPGLLAEYRELSEFLETHPDSKALSDFIATHPAIAPIVAHAAPATASTGWFWPALSGFALGHLHYEMARRAQQAPHAAGQQLDIVGPSIHRYRASGIHIDLNNIAQTLTDVAQAAAKATQAVTQVTTAISSVGYATGAEVVVNPVWTALAKVLGEVSTGFRMTGLPLRPDQETFLRVVEHLGQVVNGLALNPSDPALLAEYKELGDFLAAHPDSKALSAFVATHPTIVAVTVPSPASPASRAPATVLVPAVVPVVTPASPTHPTLVPAVIPVATAPASPALPPHGAATGWFLPALGGYVLGRTGMLTLEARLGPPTAHTGWAAGAQPVTGDPLGPIRATAAGILASLRTQPTASPLVLQGLEMIATPNSTMSAIVSAIESIRQVATALALQLQGLLPRDPVTGGLLQDAFAVLAAAHHKPASAKDMVHTQESNPGWGLGPGQSAPTGNWAAEYWNAMMKEPVATGPGSAVTTQYR
jgi:hypothetical protein